MGKNYNKKCAYEWLNDYLQVSCLESMVFKKKIIFSLRKLLWGSNILWEKKFKNFLNVEANSDIPKLHFSPGF